MEKVDKLKLKNDWKQRGYSFGVFRDPPGQVWANFVHKTDELVVLADGEIKIEIEGRSHFHKFGEEQFIPAKALHTVRNTGRTYNVWYYGYKTILDFD